MIDTNNPVIEFTAQDRCDGCGAQAYYAARSELGELLFCSHHMDKSFDRLRDEGWDVVVDSTALDRLRNPQNYVDVSV